MTEETAIPTTIISVLLAVLLLVMGSVGYKNRLFTTITLFLRVAFAFVFGYALAGPLGWAMAKIAPNLGMAFWEFTAFDLIFGAVFLVLTYATLVYVEADDVVVPNFLDRLGGAVLGVLTGALLGGVLLVAYSMAVTFSPVRFVVEESDFKLDPGKALLHEFGRLHEKIPGTRPFDTAQAVEAYRNADAEAVKRAKGAAPVEKPPAEKKGRGPAGDIEEDSSAGNLRKQLQDEK